MESPGYCVPGVRDTVLDNEPCPVVGLTAMGIRMARYATFSPGIGRVGGRVRVWVASPVIVVVATAALLAVSLMTAGSAHAQRGKKAGKKDDAGTPTLARTKAKSWEVLAFNSVPIPAAQQLAPYLWAYRTTCDNLDNDMARRQCLGLRTARRAQVAGKTFFMSGDSRSLLAGRYNADAKGSQFKVYSCFSCTRTIDAQGAPLYVVGQGDITVFGTQILGPVVHDTIMPFKNAQEAAAWKKDVAPRLRAEYIVRIQDSEPFWTRGGVQGVTVEVQGFRVHDPCTGKIVVSIPKAKNLPADESRCTGADLLALQRARDAANKPKPVDPTSKLPPRLTPKDIQVGLAPATKAAQQCFAIYAVAGEAKFRIKINGAGKVTEIEQTGYFKDTPTGECMEEAIRQATFPATQKQSTTVNYPFVLR